jgi:hypothetical protein
MFLLCGLLFGFAYLTKIVALVFLPPLVLLMVLKGSRKLIIPFLATILLVLSIECIAYSRVADSPWLRYETTKGGIEKNVFDVFRLKPKATSQYFTYYGYAETFYFFKLMINRSHSVVRNHFFFLWGWLALAGFLLSLWKRKLIVPLLFLYMYTYFEFGFSLIRFEEGGLHYYQIFKEPKYFLITLPAVSLLSAVIFDEVIRLQRTFGVVALVAVLGWSIWSTRFVYDRYYPVMKDVKAAARYMVEKSHREAVYVDPDLLDVHMRLFSGDVLRDIRTMQENAVLADDAIVVRGGSRGLHRAPATLVNFYKAKMPLLLEPTIKGTSTKLELLETFDTPIEKAGYNPLALYRVVNIPKGPNAPPILEISVQETADRKVLINGYVEAIGGGNVARMSLYINNEKSQEGFYLPIWVPLTRGRNEIKVVARDAYGQETERSLSITMH